jgi:murein L,D-transpeptidase YafK
MRDLVENWRRAWEEGDLQTYTNCYHTDFKTKKMNILEWKNYKQDLFSSSAKRNVQIDDIQIQTTSAGAVVTFKQSYQTAKHRDVGLKTLHMRRQQQRWVILQENWQPLSG